MCALIPGHKAALFQIKPTNSNTSSCNGKLYKCEIKSTNSIHSHNMHTLTHLHMHVRILYMLHFGLHVYTFLRCFALVVKQWVFISLFVADSQNNSYIRAFFFSYSVDFIVKVNYFLFRFFFHKNFLFFD